MKFVAAVFTGLVLNFNANAAVPESYSFISGDDLYDALSQESMVLQGYTLGVVDALKHSSNPDECFVIPLRPDADQVIYSSFLNFWKERDNRPDSAVDAIVLMMKSDFPCVSKELKSTY